MLNFIFIFSLTILVFDGEDIVSQSPGQFEMIDSLLIQKDWAGLDTTFHVDSTDWAELGDTSIMTVWTKELKNHTFQFFFLRQHEQMIPVKAVANGDIKLILLP